MTTAYRHDLMYVCGVNWIDAAQKTPVWLIAIWAIWLLGAIPLARVTAKYLRNDTIPTYDSRIGELESQIHRQSSQIAEQSRTLQDVLEAVRNIRPVRLGDLRLPEPEPGRRVDWRTAPLDATGTTDLRQLDPKKMSELFETVEDVNGLVNLVSDGKVTILRLVLEAPHPAGPKSSTGTYQASLTLRNNTSTSQQAFVPGGQVFENVKPGLGLQNLVAAAVLNFGLEPNVPTVVTVPAYCFNRRLKPPRGQDANLSPLKVRFEIQGQEQLWDRTEQIVGHPR